MNFDKASNALVTVTGFYADALATVTQERDDALAVRDMVAKELQATQVREKLLQRHCDGANKLLGDALQHVPQEFGIEIGMWLSVENARPV